MGGPGYAREFRDLVALLGVLAEIGRMLQSPGMAHTPMRCPRFLAGASSLRADLVAGLTGARRRPWR